MPDLTYRPDGQHSYFRDLALAEGASNGAGAQRLARHAQEMAVEVPAREKRARERATAAGIDLRANPSTTPLKGGTFAPPLWLLDQFASAKRTGRVLSALIPRYALPSGVGQVNVPRIVGGTIAQSSTSDLAAAPQAEWRDTSSQSPVVPIVGQSDIPLQMLEQSPQGAHLDAALFTDLMAAYVQTLEQQLVAGQSTVGNPQVSQPARQLPGVMTTGLTSVACNTAPSASSASNLIMSCSQAAGQIGDKRLVPPEVWLMRTARWTWTIASAVIGFPAFVSSTMGPSADDVAALLADQRPPSVGTFLGWPVFCDDAIPTNVGGPTAAAQDVVIACRPSDMLLLEQAPRMTVMLEALSGTLQARLQLMSSAAAITDRHPGGTAIVTGTGLAIDPNW